MTTHRIVDDEQDVPPISINLVFWLGLMLLVLAAAAGTLVGSVLLHTFDAEIRAALTSAWHMLTRLYWAWANLNG